MKLSTLYKPTILLFALFIAACQQPLLKSVAKEDVSAAIKKPPFKSNFPPPKELSKETIYHYLAAEISIQRQQLNLAYEHFMLAASLANDKTAAEKATRIALLQKRTDEALHASAKWVDYDPNSVQARQLSAILHLRNDDLQEAEQQFNALLQITDSQDSNGFLRISSLLASEKDKQRNLLLMRNLATKRPQSAQAHYAMALMESEVEQYPQAMQSLERAKDLNPSWDKPYVLQAQILAIQGDNQAAETSLKRATIKLPKEKSLHEAYGRILIENQEYKQAIRAYKKAYELGQGDLDMLYPVGMLAIQTEDWDTARESWGILLASDNDKNRNDANFFLGRVEELNHNLEQAMKHYMAVKKGKTLMESRLRLARLKAITGELEQAISIYRELRAMNSSDLIQIYSAEAQLLKELGRMDQALKLYSTAVEAYPENMDLRYARGLYAADYGDLDLAISDFELILSIEPDNADTLNALGYTLADQTDRYQEALDYILKAHQLKSDEPAIQDSLGWVLYRLGRYEEALKYLYEAASANPDAEIAAHLGEVLWILGNHSQAREVWNKALTSEPDSEKLKEVIQRLLKQ